MAYGQSSIAPATFPIMIGRLGPMVVEVVADGAMTNRRAENTGKRFKEDVLKDRKQPQKLKN
jgi:hypothetical protein